MHFMEDDQRLYYLGASCYYLAYWAADPSTNALSGLTYQQEADAYLMRCHDLGFNVIRVWAFNDGNDPHTLQPSPGVHSEAALRGFDRMLAQGNELGLRFVLTLVNNWDDYGGMRWYVTNSPTAAVHSDFYTDPQCRAWYTHHVSVMVTRSNTVNGVIDRGDPTIFAWQLANEPRWDTGPKDGNPVDTSGETIRSWVFDMTAYIKSIDPNHMVSTGEEGWTADQNWEGTRWELNNTCADIDYTVVHCWPDWWHWLWGDEPALYENAIAWVEDHLALSATLNKPMVLSEYGKSQPLDGPTGRHAYYQGWFDAIYASASTNGPAAGMHFWMMEANGSGHDDGFSVFPDEEATLNLLAAHAHQLNTLIAPRIDTFDADSAALTLHWTPIVGAPHYEVQTSSNLSTWQVRASTSTNLWSSGVRPNGTQFYRIRPFWPQP